MTAETAGRTPATATRPTSLLVGAAIAALQGAALAVWGGYDMIAALVGDPIDRGLSVFGGFVILLLGVMPLLAARGLLKLRSWGRSPAVLTSSICLPVAYYMWQTGGVMSVLAVVVALLGIVGIGSLLNPTVTAVLYPPRES
ncbi:hypothetical protein OG689_16425 [Kitasatospora sp. NBC_00240]|uniref:hypothetical protein n=1 Tax=Kitasatospora sp. NBC_00240 TaxID=2903567 RepID=UPI00224CA79B|nr:hypothetical protein [Kitasatospora sp. NBC_00240]MCX5210857.1 hypothetical protein [Kitasatospora sp. NBC_00240]